MHIKDAMSVCLYAYNRSHILQYVMFINELILQKKLQKFMSNNVGQKDKITKSIEKANITILARVGKRVQELFHRILMRYL